MLPLIEDEESCKIAGKVILQLFPDAYLMKISVSPRHLSPCPALVRGIRAALSPHPTRRQS